MSPPYLFDEFFASGQEESVSPFLDKQSRILSRHLPLKNALIAAGFLTLAFVLHFFNPPLFHLCLAVVYFSVGTPALIHAIEDLGHLEINIDVLMTVAALLSLFVGSGLEGGLLLVLFELSGAMEHAVLNKTKGALYGLQGLCPKIAHVIREDGSVFDTLISSIAPGTNILIKAGEVIPLDGTVVSGSSFVNLVHLTGESEPLALQTGSNAVAGGYNLDGTVVLKVTHSSADSTLQKMIHLITQAQEAKPRLESFLDRYGSWYSMGVISLSFLFSLILPFILHIPFFGQEGSIYRALTFLIAASPCALIIATPTAYFSALSSCAKRGILLKGSTMLDRLASCKAIAFDKTGTLTTGQLVCTKIDPLLSHPHFKEEMILSIAASLENKAIHPIGHALVRYAEEKKQPLFPVTDFKQIAGVGLEGTLEIDGKSYLTFIGRPEGILPFLSQEQQKKWKDIAKTRAEQDRACLAIDNAVYGFHFEDELRPESRSALNALHPRFSIAMVTGDHTNHAQEVAASLGITQVYANLRPEDKLAIISKLSEKEELIMVGDGVNDAPALARAHVGIAMGKRGSSTAVYASDVIFLQEDLSLIEWLWKKSKKTKEIVRENLLVALGVICLATTPSLLGYIPLWLAVILHEGGTLLVGLNSLRLLKK